MRRNLLSIIFVLAAFYGFGQLTITPDDISVEADLATTDAVAYFSVTNEGPQTAKFWWTLEVDNAPTNWEYWVCDANLCYFAGRYLCPEDRPNEIPAGETNDAFAIHYNPQGNEGSGTVKLRLTQVYDGDTTTNLVEVDIALKAALTSSNENISELEEISVYPNPTSDFFFVKNGQDIEEIEILNMIGKKLKSEAHKPGKAHYITDLDLENGVYLVRMLDRNNKIQKVMKIFKE